MTHTLSSQIAAVSRMARLDVIRKLTSRASEQELLLAQLRAAQATLEEVNLAKSNFALAPTHEAR